MSNDVIRVNILKVGAPEVTVELKGGATLKDALAALKEVLGESSAVIARGDDTLEDVDESTPLKDGDDVSVVQPIEGGC